jgi:hypothetical protein
MAKLVGRSWTPACVAVVQFGRFFGPRLLIWVIVFRRRGELPEVVVITPIIIHRFHGSSSSRKHG